MNTVGNKPMGTHGGHGMSHAEKAPDGHTAHMGRDHLKSMHLERAARIHEMHREKMGTHGVLMDARGADHINMDAAYRSHHNGDEFGTTLAAMSTPREMSALRHARAMVATAQSIEEPREVENEII